MKFSLILCTLHRFEEVRLFLDSLAAQEYRNFELLVVDQNKESRLPALLETYKNLFPIKYFQSLPGLSRSRNIALPHVSGDIVAFPDDDCLYPKELLKQVHDFFNSHPYHGVNTRIENSLDNGVKVPNPGVSKKMTFNDAFATGSIALFFRKEIFDRIGLFDENLGLGSDTPFKGGEDAEIIIRAMKLGFTFYNEDSIVVLHPFFDASQRKKTEPEFIASYEKRIKSAGASDYYIFKKHYSLPVRTKLLITNTIMMMVHFLKGEKDLFRNHVLRLQGFREAMAYRKSV